MYHSLGCHLSGSIVSFLSLTMSLCNIAYLLKCTYVNIFHQTFGNDDSRVHAKQKLIVYTLCMVESNTIGLSFS